MENRTRFEGRIPLATYRLQFNRHFRFRDAAALVPYLHRLGISDLYASPYLRARPGSLHGYDISNHNELNPEIGFREDHEAMILALHEHGMGHLLDIVPNHMGIAESSNRWWMDVLENGPSSPFARFFDIDWHPLKRELDGKVLLPVLGDHFGEVLERGELRLVYEDGSFRIEYFESRFPVAPKSVASVLGATLQLLEGRLDAEHPDHLELESILTALEHLPPRHRTDPASVAERRRENRVTQRRLMALTTASTEVRTALLEAVQLFSGTEGNPASFERLEALLDEQVYRLAFWRVAAEEINYRRFFDINDLAGVRVERPEVFEETHRLILRLVGEGKLDGLRIDHPDGLFDPRGYLFRLQERASEAAGSPATYILVEKILTGEEQLPADWPVAGTVGYDLMDRLNRLFVASGSAEAMDAAYARFVPQRPDFEELVYRKKKLILRHALASELNVLAHLLDRLSERNRRSRDYTLVSLTEALREVIACFPVYRTYVDARAGRLTDGDRQYIEEAMRSALRRNRGVSASVFGFVTDVLLLRWPEGLDAEARAEHAEFVMKFQQLTGPVMAKGVEDTSFYIYNRLVSLNEVGGEPARFGLEPDAFHAYVAERAARWPHAMNATSTHDTKRSEDVRARIHVLSEIPELWGRQAAEWARLNEHRRPTDEGQPVPSRNDEYLFYQTLVGTWPFDTEDDEAWGRYVDRMTAYLEKAAREAKLHTSWINPSEAYDTGLREFVGSVLRRTEENPFLAAFAAFHAAEIAVPGMLNALAQLVLKLTLPGVPDTYQGQESWDFSLVDPDNRRPVDYARLRRMLEEVLGRLGEVDRAAAATGWLGEWRDGTIKLFLTHAILEQRRASPELFTFGDYVPLRVSGSRAANVVAFARRADAARAVVAVPRLLSEMVRQNDGLPPLGASWAGTQVEGGAALGAGAYRNVLTDDVLEVGGETPFLAVERLFETLPFAVLVREG